MRGREFRRLYARREGDRPAQRRKIVTAREVTKKYFQYAKTKFWPKTFHKVIEPYRYEEGRRTVL